MDEGKMISIFIGFSKPKNRIPVIGYIFSWAIRLLEQTPYSHVYLRWYSSGAKVGVVYEASGTKVQFSSKKKVFEQFTHIVKEYEIKITRAQYKKLISFAMSNAGVSYGMKGALGIVWVYAGKTIGKKWKNPFADGDYTWFCNELGGAAIENVKGIDTGIDLESVGPKGFDEWLSTYDGAELTQNRGV